MYQICGPHLSERGWRKPCLLEEFHSYLPRYDPNLIGICSGKELTEITPFLWAEMEVRML